jgi:hypothetical protein
VSRWSVAAPISTEARCVSAISITCSGDASDFSTVAMAGSVAPGLIDQLSATVQSSCARQ